MTDAGTTGAHEDGGGRLEYRQVLSSWLSAEAAAYDLVVTAQDDPTQVLLGIVESDDDGATVFRVVLDGEMLGCARVQTVRQVADAQYRIGDSGGTPVAPTRRAAQLAVYRCGTCGRVGKWPQAGLRGLPCGRPYDQDLCPGQMGYVAPEHRSSGS